MNAQDLLEELRPLGRDSYKRVLFKHGVREPCFGVKISDLQGLVKRHRMDHRLALGLFATGNYDAMYLAGLIADDARMTRDDLREWVAKAYCRGLAGATVAWVAAGSPHGWELGREWTMAEGPLTAAAGWATLASWVSVRPDPELDLPELKRLLQWVRKSIHEEPDLVRYQMNAFVIAVGSYVAALTETAIQTAEAIGPVTADFGDTACGVPAAAESIRKVQQRGTVGKKRKTAKC
jgi:hypothetical protein